MNEKRNQVSKTRSARHRVSPQHALTVVRLKAPTLGISELRASDVEEKSTDFSQLEFLIVENSPSKVLLILSAIIKSRPQDFRSPLACHDLAHDLETLATKAGRFEIHHQRQAKAI